MCAEWVHACGDGAKWAAEFGRQKIVPEKGLQKENKGKKKKKITTQKGQKIWGLSVDRTRDLSHINLE